nr:immunoglobulin light chain junction region [Macaca mulatta]MOX81749.1 immunoglobulin light chain junction region [Macaca mulatta]MOX82144.1 immunoglobulin light chain junction region [Macaca mulatta]MOX82354.1 immunoglobulin light chain junction region [Macaca mulatta]MOX82929.1 immunoglobulin light chain junction region [Macaca mulatta]
DYYCQVYDVSGVLF